MIHAQRVVNAVLDSENTAFGVYETLPQARLKVLSDIRAVAGRALAYATPEDLKVWSHRTSTASTRVWARPRVRGPDPHEPKPSLGWPHRHEPRLPLSE